MRIAVCLKQVPDTTEVRIDPETNTLVRQGVASIINPFDLFALEAALRLKEAAGGTVTLLSMGPPQAEEALREGLGFGADEAVLLTDRAFAGADTWATSLTLAAAIRHLGPFDLVVCGKQAIDGDTAQVGPGLAQHLGWPFVAGVKAFEVPGEGRLRLSRMMDDGYQVVEMDLPGLLTVVREVGEPRPPSLKAKMRAKKAEIKSLGAADLGLDEGRVGLAGSFTQVVKVFAPTLRAEREMIEGEAAVQARRVLDKLVDGGVIKVGLR
ncbi:MAG: electron transfer flavoprotein subunit beta/FixA family protein [Proteobacteria bacterium]|nr:electron transfer flavoprotein subunit beta/FixA family protein [Pseudomonadota bacterium]MBU1742620.1 electron transfer flavoprotein subunit beta/FixA family protein [Pseudomonadota bacterium]